MAPHSIIWLSILSFTALATAQTCPSYTPVCGVAETGGSKGNPGRDRLCGRAGTLSRTMHALTSCDAASFGDCRDSCLSNTQCLSFGFDSTNNSCTLYSRTLNAHGFGKDPSATVEYWNRKCFSYQACGPPSKFYLQVQPGSGSNYDGYYGILNRHADGTVQFTTTATDDATVFAIDSEGAYSGDIDASVSGAFAYANIDTIASEETLFFNTASSIQGQGSLWTLATCSLPSEAPFALSCNDNGDTVFYLNGTTLVIADSDYQPPAGEVMVTLLAVSAT